MTDLEKQTLIAELAITTTLDAKTCAFVVNSALRKVEMLQSKPLTPREWGEGIAEMQREEAARTAACSAAHMMGIESSQANTIITTYLKALEK